MATAENLKLIGIQAIFHFNHSLLYRLFRGYQFFVFPNNSFRWWKQTRSPAEPTNYLPSIFPLCYFLQPLPTFSLPSLSLGGSTVLRYLCPPKVFAASINLLPLAREAEKERERESSWGRVYLLSSRGRGQGFSFFPGTNYGYLTQFRFEAAK